MSPRLISPNGSVVRVDGATASALGWPEHDAPSEAPTETEEATEATAEEATSEAPEAEAKPTPKRRTGKRRTTDTTETW